MCDDIEEYGAALFLQQRFLVLCLRVCRTLEHHGIRDVLSTSCLQFLLLLRVVLVLFKEPIISVLCLLSLVLLSSGCGRIAICITC